MLKSKKLSLAAVFGLLVTTVVATPVWAETETVTCTTGEITITNNVVTGNTNCAGLVVIPSSVTSIDSWAFIRAEKLEHVIFASGPSGSKLTTIGEGAFYKAGLTSITIPGSVTSIGELAFASNRALAFVNFSTCASCGDTFSETRSQLTTIGVDAFGYATALQSITIPSNVTSIGMGAFRKTTSLETVTFAAGSALTDIGNSAFAEATALTSITIPDGVTSIDLWAFSGAISLEAVTIPDSVTSIGQGAFVGATKLTRLTFEGNAPSTGPHAFTGTSAVAYIAFASLGFEENTTWEGLKYVKASSDCAGN